VDLLSEEAPKSVGRWLWDNAKTWGPAILLVLLIRLFIFEPFKIPSGSMVPTLAIGDHVVVTKFAYGVWVPSVYDIPLVTNLMPPHGSGKWPLTNVELIDMSDPQRGDIIVFRFPNDERYNYIKRIVAIPGDTIQVKNNKITLNGEPEPTVFVDRMSFVNQACGVSNQKRYVETIGEVPHYVLTSTGAHSPLANYHEYTVPKDTVFVMGDNRDNSEDSRAWGIVRYDQIKGKAHFIWLSWDACSEGVGSKIRQDRIGQSLYKKPEVPAEPALQ
jgi:signal peptidase I